MATVQEKIDLFHEKLAKIEMVKIKSISNMRRENKRLVNA